MNIDLWYPQVPMKFASSSCWGIWQMEQVAFRLVSQGIVILDIHSVRFHTKWESIGDVKMWKLLTYKYNYYIGLN